MIETVVLFRIVPVVLGSVMGSEAVFSPIGDYTMTGSSSISCMAKGGGRRGRVEVDVVCLVRLTTGGGFFFTY